VNSTLKSLVFCTALDDIGVLVCNVSNQFQTSHKPLTISEFM
jgi:hypothetical protein